MEKNFMTVLHEEEMLDDTSLDALKGGQCNGTYCPCNNGGPYCDHCNGFNIKPNDPTT